MGFIDKIFRGRKNNSEKEKLEASSASQSKEVDYHLDIDYRIAQRNQSPAAQDINRVVQEQARKAQLEMAKLEFSKTHATVENFRKEFLVEKFRRELGITAPGSQSPYMKKLDALQTSNLISKRDLSKIFLPYLIEKKALKIISAEEQQELNAILGTTGKRDDIENATTTESYTLDFNKSLIILGAIGVINLEPYTPSKEFSNGKAMRTIGVDYMSSVDLAIESSSLANKIYTQQIQPTQLKKNITPAEVAKNALLQTSTSTTIAAKNIEEAELTSEKGETRDGK